MEKLEKLLLGLHLNRLSIFMQDVVSQGYRKRQ